MFMRCMADTHYTHVHAMHGDLVTAKWFQQDFPRSCEKDLVQQLITLSSITKSMGVMREKHER